jgi:uncharacterized heparinase superfamily protein
MQIGELARTWRTVRHLRAGQVVQRLCYRVRRARWERRSAAVDASYTARASRLAPLRWDHPGLARVAAHRARLRAEARALAAARDALEGRFDFLGRCESFGARVDWFRPDLDRGTRLWKTLLHEFPYAEDLARAALATGDPAFRTRWLELARDWRRAAPIGCPGFALDAWNARAVATRLVHWAVAGSLLGLRPGDPDADWLGREIGVHGLFLRDNLELDLRGNHLFRDAVGLVFAQELAGGVPDARDWLERQVREQVLPDGCHVERAPLYHAMCLDDLVEVRLLLGRDAPAWLDDAVARMAGWLDAVALGDGEIPLLGDGWLGERPSQALLAAAREQVEPCPPEAPERHGGIVPLRAGDWRAVVRAGPHAPDEQMGHAHADLLSFDASLGAVRVVTDTGTLLYDPGPDRQRVRGTAAHNTLRLDGAEQLEAWGSFRVGRRGRAWASGRGREHGWDWVAGFHDAYRWLPGRPIHHRVVALGSRGILVLDAVLGEGRHRIESHLNRHPSGEERGARIVALGSGSSRHEVALHEHFGETRSMRQQRVEADASLPWFGGWWIEVASEASAAEPRWLPAARGVRVELLGQALEWQPGALPELRIALCSDERGSAN